MSGNTYLYHHGIKGQKWGVRRFQNADGTVTSAGKKRYGATRQANKVAQTARKESIANDRARSKSGERITIRQANNNARKAADTARRQLKEEKRLSKKLNKYGLNQNKVVDKMNTDRLADKTFSDKWSSAFKAGKGTKEWSEYEKYAKDFIKRYEDEYVDAWIKDNNIKHMSDRGREYVKKKMFS